MRRQSSSARLAASAAAVACLVLAGLGLVAPPAALAGGPTSVLLSSPGSGSTAALYHSDARYDQLSRALGQHQSNDPGAPDLHGGPGTPAINVTWLIHDVSVWRVDRVFVDVEGGPWVETLTATGGVIDFGDSGVVNRPADPASLLGVLDQLGLLDGDAATAAARADDRTGDGAGAAAAPGGQAARVPPSAAAPAAAAPFSWWWLLTGLVAGAVLGAAARPAAGVLARLRRARAGYSG